MSDMVFCGSCGGQILAAAKFCEHCGANQADFVEEAPTQVEPPSPADPPAQVEPPTEVEEPTEVEPPAQPEPPTQVEPPPPPSPPPTPPPAPPAPTPPPSPEGQSSGARESAERVAPGAGDLAEQLAKQLNTPGVALAMISALAGLAAVLAAGLLLAIVTPNASFLSLGGSGLLKETLAQAVSFSQANLNGTSFEEQEAFRTVPVLFVLIPILGIAFGTAIAANQTTKMSVRDRLLWAAASGVPFAVAMLVLSLSIGEIDIDLIPAKADFSSGSVFLLSLIWGALGGLAGMLYALRQEGAEMPSGLPAGPARVAAAAWTALRPLALALVAVGAISTLVWVVQMARDDDYRDFPERSAAVAVGEQLAYAGDHAINTLPLGAGSSQRLTLYPVIPIPQDEVFPNLIDEASPDSEPTYNLFDFSGTMSPAIFIPMMIVLIAIPALLALYAGFAVAQRVGERRPGWAAGWGAIVGPIWAVSMVLLATLARKNLFGDPTGDSVFVAFLLGGAVLGAIGGLLGAQSAGGSSPGVASSQKAAS